MPSKFNKLQDARVLLIGGTSGIGFATAEAAIEGGAVVIVASSNAGRVANTVDRLTTAYPEAASKVSGHQVDLSKAESMESNLKALLEFATNGNTVKLDHIAYTAANIPKIPAVLDYTVSETKPDYTLLRYEAPIILGKLAPSYLNPGPRSSITFTGASTAVKPTPGRAVLTAVGAATEGVARGLAVDLAPIRVNAVSPGTTDTELLRALAGPDPKLQAGFKEMLKKATLLNKVGEPEDVAEAYIYLMKDSNITGATIYSDSGRQLK